MDVNAQRASLHYSASSTCAEQLQRDSDTVLSWLGDAIDTRPLTKSLPCLQPLKPCMAVDEGGFVRLGGASCVGHSCCHLTCVLAHSAQERGDPYRKLVSIIVDLAACIAESRATLGLVLELYRKPVAPDGDIVMVHHT